MRTSRAPYAVASALAALAWTTTAAPQGPVPAPPDKEACASAHEDAQVFRKRGKLIEARGKLQLCAADACPALARQDCGVWLVEVEERVPTIVLHAKDAHGAPTKAVKCALDGAPLVETLDEGPVPINPGAHALKCEMEGSFVVQALAVVEGEKSRRVDLSFEPSPPPPPSVSAAPSAVAPPGASIAAAPPPPREVSPAVYALAGLAVVGLGGFAYFGLTGLNDESNLRNTCHSSCNPSDVNAVTTKYHVADASLVVGIVAASLAGWIYLSRPAPPGAPQSGARIGVTATPGGGAARVEVRF